MGETEENQDAPFTEEALHHGVGSLCKPEAKFCLKEESLGMPSEDIVRQ